MAGNASDVIDPAMKGGSNNEIMRCIHIGLLCVQENPITRPNMASIALMLHSHSVALEVPSKPPFTMYATESAEASHKPEPSLELGASKNSAGRPVTVLSTGLSITELQPR